MLTKLFKIVSIGLCSLPLVAFAEAPSSSTIVQKKMENLLLTIPKGNVRTNDISANYYRDYDYIAIWGLLPCLDPEDEGNVSEFQRNNLGRVLVITLSGGRRGLAGRDLLEFDNKISLLPEENSGSDNFLLYKNFPTGSDLYVMKDSSSLTFAACDMDSKWIPYPQCSVREFIWGNVLLEYRYERHFIDNNLDNIIMIHNQVHHLLDSFADSSTDSAGTNRKGTCQ